MSRYTPTVEEAEGMREGVLSQRRMEGLTSPEPYTLLDFTKEADRRIIGSVYALMARAAMPATTP